jgi:hypothetical protein
MHPALGLKFALASYRYPRSPKARDRGHPLRAGFRLTTPKLKYVWSPFVPDDREPFTAPLQGAKLL